MSYAFSMAFWPAPDLTGAFAKAQAVKASLLEPANADARLKACLPGLLDQLDDIVPGREPTLSGRECGFLSAWLESAFTVRFTWWPERLLLALSGDAWPKACLPDPRRFPAVLFQDSSDQDYDGSAWPDLPFFRGTFREAMDCPERDVAAAMGASPSAFRSDEGYQRRSYAYKLVERRLGLKEWMRGQRSPGFERFALCAIDSYGQEAGLLDRARKLTKEVTWP